MRTGVIAAISLAWALTIPGSASQETPWDLATGFAAYVTMPGNGAVVDFPPKAAATEP